MYKKNYKPLDGRVLPPPLCVGLLKFLGRSWFTLLMGEGISEVVNCMFMARPSRGTPLYCFIALMASLLRSNMTSAVPSDRPERS